MYADGASVSRMRVDWRGSRLIPPQCAGCAPCRHQRHGGVSRVAYGAPMDQIPDSSMTRAAGRLLRSASAPAMVNHCLRSHAWAVALAAVDGLAFDAELLFVAAALHDLGLEEDYERGNAFEEDGGRAAAAFVRHSGGTDAAARVVERAVVLHVAREVTLADGVESYLLWEATGADVSGSRLGDLATPWFDNVMASYPRLGFVADFGGRLGDQAARKPQSRAAQLVRGGLLERLAACPLNGPELRPTS